jgi:hypothetical protein
MKTDGQIVYEHKNPSHISVVPTQVLPFPTAADVVLVPNPVHQAPWNLLTEECRQSWEQYAVGHYLVSKGNQNV